MKGGRKGAGEELQRDIRKCKIEMFITDCGDDFKDVNICQNLSNYTHLSAVYFM